MKKLVSLLYLLIISSGCVSTGTNPESVIYLPKANKEIEIKNLKEAKENKVNIGEKLGLKFEFYYGSKGSYYVIIYPKDEKKGSKIELKYYDVFLEIDRTGKNPETLMLAQEYQNLYSGFGIVRNGKTNFQLKMIPQDSYYGKPFNLDFKVNIGGE